MLSHVPLDPNFDLELVAGRTGGYSPSDIREVLQTAALYPLREARAEAMASTQIYGGSNKENGVSVPTRMGMPTLRELRTDDVMRALQYSKPTHFSRRYRRELMKYVQNSGGSLIDPNTSSPSVSTLDVDTGAFNTNYFDQGNTDESDSYSYDEDTSDSDYDDF